MSKTIIKENEGMNTMDLAVSEIIPSNFTGYELVNTELIDHSNNIQLLMNDIKKNMFAVAVELAKIADSECYKEEFKNMSEYGKAVFNFKKTTIYSLIKIGREFTDTITLESNLPHNAKDFTTKQIECMLPLKEREIIVEAIADEKLNPDMTVADIKKVVKSLMPKNEKDKSKNELADSVENETGNSEFIHIRKFVEDDKVVLYLNDIECTLEGLIEELTMWVTE